MATNDSPAYSKSSRCSWRLLAFRLSHEGPNFICEIHAVWAEQHWGYSQLISSASSSLLCFCLLQYSSRACVILPFPTTFFSPIHLLIVSSFQRASQCRPYSVMATMYLLQLAHGWSVQRLINSWMWLWTAVKSKCVPGWCSVKGLKGLGCWTWEMELGKRTVHWACSHHSIQLADTSVMSRLGRKLDLYRMRKNRKQGMLTKLFSLSFQSLSPAFAVRAHTQNMAGHVNYCTRVEKDVLH